MRVRVAAVGEIAEKTGFSKRQASKVRRVAKDPQMSKAVESGEMSVREADEKLREKAAPPKRKSRKREAPPIPTTTNDLTTTISSLRELARQMKAWGKGKIEGNLARDVEIALGDIAYCLPPADTRGNRVLQYAKHPELWGENPFEPDKNPYAALVLFCRLREQKCGVALCDFGRDIREVKTVTDLLAQSDTSFERVLTAYFADPPLYLAEQTNYALRGLRNSIGDVLGRVVEVTPQIDSPLAKMTDEERAEHLR